MLSWLSFFDQLGQLHAILEGNGSLCQKLFAEVIVEVEGLEQMHTGQEEKDGGRMRGRCRTKLGRLGKGLKQNLLCLSVAETKLPYRAGSRAQGLINVGRPRRLSSAHSTG